MLRDGIVGGPSTSFCSDCSILARGSFHATSLRAGACRPLDPIRRVRHPAAGLSPITPERQPDEPHLFDFANRVVRTQNGDDLSARLRILAIRLLAHEPDNIGHDAPLVILVSWDNDRALSSREIHDALNSLLGLSLPTVAGRDQQI